MTYTSNLPSVARAPDFVAFVCKTLELYSSSSKLDKFLIDFDYKTSYASEVNKWVCFATIHKVRKLYLEFETSGSSYLFPRRLCTSSTLKTLSRRFRHFTKKPTICWGTLKVQWIGYARLQSDHTFTGLKKLELVGEKVLANSDDDSAIVEISAPNLQSLNISGFMNKKRFQLTQLLNMEETAVT
ncbi:hypothetical protein CFP56_028569 [Quercus suber]|uniref:Uncharacterized protein n=1 Tax=Quercus suber TaxID=58331 RepID=A0AAW0JUA5_QUESU